MVYLFHHGGIAMSYYWVFAGLYLLGWLSEWWLLGSVTTGTAVQALFLIAVLFQRIRSGKGGAVRPLYGLTGMAAGLGFSAYVFDMIV